MMSRSKTDYPHPVLSNDGDDYIESCIFGIDIDEQIYEDSETAEFKIRYYLECDNINELLNTGKACVIISVESPNASFRTAFSFNEGIREKEISIIKNKVSKKLTIRPYIVAMEDICGFTSELFNKEYFDNAVFDIRKGDVLAYEQQYDIIIDDIDDLKNCASIFSIRLDEQAAAGKLEVDYNDEKINILMDRQGYENYNNLKYHPELRTLLSSVLVLPALVEAIEAIRREELTHEEGIEDRRWYLVIDRQLKKKGIRVTDIQSSVAVANELLGHISHTVLTDLKMIEAAKTDADKEGGQV